TALDLFVAAFCALTAVYTAVRPSSATTSAAAGTAIGIALLPPLCAAGFGLGTGSQRIASGAALLFTANISAILVLSVLAFLALGFHGVDLRQLEAGLGTGTTRADRAAAKAEAILFRAFRTRWGIALRMLVPAVILAAVSVPLSRALEEVTWEVRARKSVRAILDDAAPHTVQTTLAVERHTVVLSIVVVGSADQSAALTRTLETRIQSVTNVVPVIRVIAVTDAATVGSLIRGPAPLPRRPAESVAEVRQNTRSALEAVWPRAAAGPLAGWEFTVRPSGGPLVTVHHLGPALGEAGRALLESALSTRVGASVAISDHFLQPNVIAARAGREAVWLDSARQVFAWVGQATGTVACVVGPVSGERTRTRAERLAPAVRRSAADLGSRVTFRDSLQWRVHVAIGACAPADSTQAATAVVTRLSPRSP
ncbi:MAG: DUF389 domain-containing protein, partial [Gemmatimonadaceae bacterium]